MISTLTRMKTSKMHRSECAWDLLRLLVHTYMGYIQNGTRAFAWNTFAFLLRGTLVPSCLINCWKQVAQDYIFCPSFSLGYKHTHTTLHYYNISRSNGIYFLSNHIHGLLVIWTSLFRSKERLPFSARIISWSVMGADTSLRLLWALVALRTKAMSWTQRSSFCFSFVAKEPPCFVRKGISLESKYNASGLIPKPGKRLRIVASRMWNASRILRY